MDPSSPQRMRYYYQATSHQDAAIRQARPHLVHLSEEHCEAMFWFSAYTSLYALAEPLLRPWPLTGVNDNNINDSNESLDPIKELIHSFQLGRGINLIIRQHWDYFQRYSPDSTTTIGTNLNRRSRRTTHNSWHSGT